jgi:hypothetical protein
MTPPSVALALIPSAPSLAQAAYDGRQIIATWQWPGGATGANVKTGYHLVLTTDTSLPLPSALIPAADMAIAVAASATVAPTSVNGPYGPRFALPTGQPTITSVDYDGNSAEVGWTRVMRATGYIISVVTASATDPVAHRTAAAGATRTRFAVAITDTSKSYNVVVQAVVNESSGPCSGAVALFQPGFYFSTTPELPCLFLAPTLALAPAAMTAYLPDIGPVIGLPIAPQHDSDPAPFTLAANLDAATKLAFPYTLTIANLALAFTPSRADLAGLYGTLLTTAANNGATPWGIFQLQQVIARLMPQTFAETLFYSYGMLSTDQYADLRPGMILRVAFSEFDLVGSNKPPAWAVGYAGGAVVDYEVGDYHDPLAAGGWLVGFDAFLGWLTAAGTITIPQPTTENPPPIGAAFRESGAADAADLFFSTFRQPFYRLFFPANLQATTPAAEALTANQFTIAAASTYAAITSATTAPTADVAVAYFRGRAVLKLCIRVIINGVEEIVPVGTTVGNLLDRVARRPPRAAIALRGFSLERPLGPAVLDPALYDVSASYRVRFDWKTLATFDGQRDALSLPLLHGDRVTIGLQ